MTHEGLSGGASCGMSREQTVVPGNNAHRVCKFNYHTANQ